VAEWVKRSQENVHSRTKPESGLTIRLETIHFHVAHPGRLPGDADGMRLSFLMLRTVRWKGNAWGYGLDACFLVERRDGYQ
jgi:hypothetical protein